jgi:hypothetical protein
VRFNTKNLSEIEKIVDIRVIQDKMNCAVYLDEEQYLITMLDRFKIRTEKYKSKKIPTANYELLCLAK